MIELLKLLGLLWNADPCAVAVEAPVLAIDARSNTLSVTRKYGVPWAVCASERGGKPPVLRVTARDGAGSEVLLEKTLDMRHTLSDGTAQLSGSVQLCPSTPPNRRDAGAVLHGPEGGRHWHNKRSIEVELIAEGPYAPLAFKTQTEVLCRACSDRQLISFSHYINDFQKHTARMVMSLDKTRYECAKGGGELMLRRFWAAPGEETWAPLRPYEVIEHFESRLTPKGDSMMYEVVEPAARFCKPGKSHLFELVGVDEFSSIVRKNYGPSDAIHRAGIEFLKCQ